MLLFIECYFCLNVVDSTHSSIFVCLFLKDNFPKTIPASSSQQGGKATTPTSYYHENCVFNTLTGQKAATGSVSCGSGYDSDSSYIIKKNASKQGTLSEIIEWQLD